jgi:hypothetical protein
MNLNAYVCEWERLDSPTRGMSQADMLAHYKAHAIAGDCAFALRPGANLPADIRAGWEQLAAAVSGRKETPAHKAIRDGLRKAWRTWADGRPYTVPQIEAPKAKRTAKPGCCPSCGQIVTVAA